MEEPYVMCWNCKEKVPYDKNDLRPYIWCDGCGAATKNPNLESIKKKYYPSEKQKWEKFD